MKHFKLTTESKVNFLGTTLFRMELIIDCKWGKSGDKGGWLESEDISGNARVYVNAWVSGDAQVYGDAWDQSPLQIQGSRHFITECKRGFLQIGCKCFSFKEWSVEFNKIGKIENYTETQIKEYSLYIKLAIELSELI